jgi:hypothetical protein
MDYLPADETIEYLSIDDDVRFRWSHAILMQRAEKMKWL